MTDLRAELGAPPDPEFDLELPPGWTRSVPDDATLRSMLAAARQRLMTAHRPDLYAEVRTMLEASFDEMRKHGVVAFFSATEAGEDTLFVPASLNASIRTAEPGETLDDLVRGLIHEHGATPLLGDKRTLRVEHEQTVRPGTDTIVSHSVVYLTPMPGSRRRRALQLVAGFARAPQTPSDDPSVERMRALFDACASTVRWRRPQPPQDSAATDAG